MLFRQLRAMRGKRTHRWVAGSATACVVMLTLALVSPFSTRDEPSHCHDAEAAAQWADLVHRNPGEPAYRYLHDLRYQLCLMIDDGAIGVDDASAVFERERLRLYRILRQRERADQRTDPEALS